MPHRRLKSVGEWITWGKRMTDSQQPKICDYEGSNYRTDFWEGRGRNYEDRVERDVLKRILPKAGRRLVVLGAGFGRMVNEFQMFDEVVLLDYSFSQLQYAREQHGDDGFLYVAADAYKLPFKAGVFDGATMIRVLHHMADVQAVLSGVRRVMAPGSTFILEYANKRNLKAMLRYALKRQAWSPYTQEPVEFVELNFDFHPQFIDAQLNNAGFTMNQQIPVSFLRLGLLKKTLPTSLLVNTDRFLQRTGLIYSPSIFTQNFAVGHTEDNLATEDIFACPQTGEPLTREGDTLTCADSSVQYAIRDGIYDFKTPL